MRCQNFIFIVLTLFMSCTIKKNDSDKKIENNISEKVNTTSSFFPVTDFIKGEINKIKTLGKNPIKYSYKKGITIDSNWIKLESVDIEFSDFTSPKIDSLNDAQSYLESVFFDNTINAFTFSYDLKENHKVSRPWKHWDIYINPESNCVSRIYLVKQIDSNISKQLTWIPEKSCKIITIKSDENTSDILDEISIKW